MLSTTACVPVAEWRLAHTELSFVLVLRLQAVVSESDPELPAKQQASLLTAAMRTMSLPLGRGALTLGLAEPLPGGMTVAVSGSPGG